MKKTSIPSLLLILALLASLLCPAVSAAPGEGEPAAEPSEAAAEPEPEAAAPETEDTSAPEPSDDGVRTDADRAPYVVPGEPYTVQAKSAMLLEMETGQILLEQDADKQVYPASMTKVMTCLLTLEHGNLTDTITVSESAMEGLSEAGSTAGLQPGEQLSLEELLYCMMLSSANEACNIAAEYVAGSVDAFVEMMNERAVELGCTGTHFANPHGLHDENHYTTARDLSLITQQALRNETFQEITSTVTHTVPATNLSEARELSTTNLLIDPDTKYYYEYASGVKTGFTTPAGLCLISTANNGRMRLLSVLCGADYVFLEDGEQVNQNFTETKALFEYGFANFSNTKVLTTLYPITQIKVLASGGPEYSLLAPDHEVTALLPADFNEEDIIQDITYTSPEGVEAPIEQGQVLGHVTVTYQGHTLGSSDLVAITDIPRSTITAQKEETGSFLAVNWWKILFFGLLGFVALYFALVAFNRYRARKRRAMRRKKVIDFPSGRRDEEDRP